MISKEVQNKKGQIITFYSHKGGTGRTMSLANVAVVMARRYKKKVLAMDWDLEAPGLHRYFEQYVEKSTETNDKKNANNFQNYYFPNLNERVSSPLLNEKKGVIDLFTDFRDEFFDKKEITTAAITHYLEQNFEQLIVPIQQAEGLHLVKSGLIDENYAQKVQTFNWREFFEKAYDFFPAFIQFLESRYDFILIDSRTGYTDTAGICTMLLPEKLVLVFTLNYQSLEGVLNQMQRAVTYRIGSEDFRPLKIYPLPSRTESKESILDIWRAKAKEDFEKNFEKSYKLEDVSLAGYFSRYEVPYFPKYAYGENIAALDPTEANNPSSIVKNFNTFTRLLISDMNITRLIAGGPEDLESDNADNLGYFAYELWGKYKDAERAEVYFQQCFEIGTKNPDHYNNYGTFTAEALKKYSQAEEYYQKALEINPKHGDAWNNLGITYGDQGKHLEAESAYQKAIEINPKSNSPWNNLGYMYIHLNELDKANHALKKSIGLGNKDLGNMNLGNLSLLRGDKGKALKYYKLGYDFSEDKENYTTALSDDYEELNMAKSGVKREDFDAVIDVLKEIMNNKK